ncbi:MAG: porphobilinogen deaminase [Chrysothrix sp. TS-e1954]|nr:MAG: porphobilinogen deaminase [Chrysothrix sp. TS-e1954]
MATIDPSASTTLSTSTTALNPETTATPGVVNIGTRRSILARVQADLVADLLRKAWPTNEYVIHAISTMGDKNQVTALHDFGAKALWTHELEAMLGESEVDAIVHCVKDMPTQRPEALTLGAILPREDPRDAVVLHPSLSSDTTLSALPQDSVIGTSSVRRSAQLKRLYPHLRFQSVRGNVQTRLRKLDESIIDGTASHTTAGAKIGDSQTVEENQTEGEKPHYSAIILAAAGMIRLGDQKRISRYLSTKNMEEVRIEGSDEGAPQKEHQRRGTLYAVGQGALGIEIRKGDERMEQLLRPLNCRKTWLACMAERSLMRTLEGGCSVPIGVETEWVDGKKQVESTHGGLLSTVTKLAGDAASTSLEGIKENWIGAEGDDELIMRAIVVSLDGTESVETELSKTTMTDADADQFGRDVARILVDKGAGKILEAINLDRKIIEGQGDA